MSNIKSFLLLTAIVVIWGLTYPVNKIIFEHQYIDAFWLSALRLIIGAASFLLIILIKRRVALPKGYDTLAMVGLSLFQISLFILLLSFGIFFTEAGRAAILVYTTPLWLAPLTVFFFKETLSKQQVIGLISGFIGITLLFAPWEISWHDKNMILGSFLSILAAISLSIGMLIIRYHTWHTAPSKLIVWQFIIGAILLTIFAHYFGDFTAIVWNKRVILTLLFNGVLATAFNYWAFMEVGRHIHVVTLSLLLLATPIIGLLSSVVWLHEPLTTNTLVATGLLLAGMGVIIIKRKTAR